MAAHPVDYHFVSRWRFDAPIEQVWSALVEPASWPKWWRGLESSRQPTHNRAQFTWRAPSGYRLHLGTTTTHIQQLERLDFSASGDLVGTGSCVLAPGPSTTVTITWDVATTKSWMNRFAWLLRPVFAFNHRQLMAAGETGLRRYLNP